MKRLSVADMQQIHRQLRDELGIDLAVDEIDGVIRLSGTVDSFASRELAEQFVASMISDRRIENALTVEVEPSISEMEEAGMDEWLARVESLPDLEQRMDVDLAERTVEKATLSFEPDEEAVIAAIDPVMNRADMIGGFEATSMDALDIETSAENEVPGDEALADAIRRELREDASTSGLSINVTVEGRVAHLHGTVGGPEDAENAEAVASRVPGLIEVVEELELEG